VLHAFKWNVAVPDERIKVRVANGLVTLEGEVTSWYQRQAAELAARSLKGVKGMINLISIRPAVKPGDIKSRIAAAFRRSAEIDAGGVQVDTADGRVTLRGRVHSWSERQQAEKAAWAAPGVIEVDDEAQGGSLTADRPRVAARRRSESAAGLGPRPALTFSTSYADDDCSFPRRSRRTSRKARRPAARRSGKKK
jgi:hypothetical protein